MIGACEHAPRVVSADWPIDVVMERLRGLASPHEAQHWLPLLADLSRSWMDADSAEAVIEAVMARLRADLGIDLAVVRLMMPDGRMPVIHAHAVPGTIVDGETDELACAAAVQQKPVSLEESQRPPALLSDFLHRQAVAAYICYPVIWRDVVLATIGLGRKHAPFSAAELALFEMITNHTAVALEKSQLRARDAAITAELRRKDAFKDRLLERMPGSSLAVVDRALTYRWISKSGFHSAGVDADAVVDCSVDAVHGGAIAEILGRHYRAALDGQQVEFPISWNDRHYTVVAAPLDRDHQGITTIVVVAHDETARVAREAELAASEARHRLVATAVTSAIWESDLRTGATTASEQLAQLFGYRTDDPELTADGFSWWIARVHDGDRERVLTGFTEAMEGDAGRWRDEYRFRKADGSYAWLQDTSVFVRDASGRAVKVVGAAVDVTAQRTAVVTLTETHRRKDRFLATLGHELRQPLGAIAPALELLRQTAPSASADALRSRDIVSRQFAHLTRLVDDVLDVARVMSGKLPLSARDVDLRSALLAALDGVKMSAASKQLRVHCDPPATPVWVRGDPDRLLQVFANLMTNAVKFTPAGGSVLASLREQDGRVTVEIADSGRGLDPGQLTNVFEWFVQRQPDASGLGIGLPLSRAIVEAHGGRLVAHSEGPGRGAVFTLELPSQHGRRAVVMVVDDDEQIRNLISSVLRRRHFEVVTAPNGAEALSLLGNRPSIDAIITDVDMPVMGGLAFCRTLREDERHRQTPVLMMSAAAGLEGRAASVGVSEILPKPFSPSELLRRVSKLINAGRSC